MKLKMFAVYDSKGEVYTPPFCMKTEGQAIRSFIETVNDKTSQIGKYPEDFTLFEIGVFDDEKGIVQDMPQINHGSGNTFVLEP